MGSEGTVIFHKIKNLMCVSIFDCQVDLRTEDAEEADRQELILLPSDE